jgi:hypothetical protein
LFLQKFGYIGIFNSYFIGKYQLDKQEQKIYLARYSLPPL